MHKVGNVDIFVFAYVWKYDRSVEKSTTSIKIQSTVTNVCFQFIDIGSWTQTNMPMLPTLCITGKLA